MGRVTRFLQASGQQQPESQASKPDGAGSRLDPDLQRLIGIWPTLPPHIKRAILTLISPAPPRRAKQPPKPATAE